MNGPLADRVWENPRLHLYAARLNAAWLQNELGLEPTFELTVEEVTKCVQAAAILAGCEAPERQRMAYRLATCAKDLFGEALPGLAGMLRIVLTEMGNFPALATSEEVAAFSRLPTRVAITEQEHRSLNEVSLGQTDMVLTDFQAELWGLLRSGSNVAISAPTSAGKSFVLQLHLRSLARANELKAACYVVPSRALIAQVTDSITAWRNADELRKLAIVNVPLTAEIELVEPSIYVLTQERLQAILATHPTFAPEIIICDEAQNVEDGARGVLLQNVIDSLLRRNPTAQVIFAGPNIKNPQVFGEIFDIQVLRDMQTKAPSVIQNLIMVNTRTPIKGHLQIDRFGGDAEEPLGVENVGHSLPSIRERLVRVSERFGRAKPSIIYANRPSTAEDIAIDLTEIFEDVEPSQRLQDLSDFIKLAVHPEYDLAQCVLKRVGFHYGRIPALVRRGVESAFEDGDIRFLVTTSTLIQGVNFPAANLFVCKPAKGKHATPLATAEFWNLAGRAGRLGKEFQGNIFLIDYPEWKTHPADEGNEVEIQSYLKRALSGKLDDIEACALENNPGQETEELVDIEAAFARLLTDHMRGSLEATLERSGVQADDRIRLTAALNAARERVNLPPEVLVGSPTMSALRQQRLADYLFAEIHGGGIKRLEELIPRHPRDPDAHKHLSEIYRICHEQLLGFKAPRLHLRMSAISLAWMRGSPLPAIIDKSREYEPTKKMRSSIRDTLREIEQDIRFKYFRLSAAYTSVLAHVLTQAGHERYVASLASLPTFLEVGASDQTMISLISLGVSRHTAKILNDEAVNKDMSPAEVLRWLTRVDINRIVGSPIMREDISRALANNGILLS